MRTPTVAVLAAACLLPAAAWAAGVDAERFVAIVEEGREQWQTPGIAVALVENGEVELLQGFGNSGAGGPPVDEHTLFANASTTKAMVAAGILMLADDGRLSLDDRVIEHLPEVHFHDEALTQQVTIRDLLAHRTGLPRTDFWTFRQRMPLEEQIRRLRLVEPAAGPRARLLYQNTMYELAGLVITRLSGEPWFEFLERRLWRPIGMHDTYGLRGRIPASRNHVLPHAVVDGEVRRVPWDLPVDRDDAAGSAWSSVHDMALWAQFLLNDGVTADGARVISAEGMAAMFEPQQLAHEDDFYPTVELTRPHWRSYGLGWFQQDFQGRKIDFHTGSLDGLTAIVGLDRGRRSAVIVLQNLDASELRHALLWEAMDLDPPENRRNWLREVRELYARRAQEDDEEWQALAAARLDDTRTSLELPAYFGVYRNDILGDVEFAARGGNADVAVPARAEHAGPVLRTGMYEYEMSHWHLDTFAVNYVTWRHATFATFAVDESGRVASVEIFDHVFDRVEAGSGDPADD